MVNLTACKALQWLCATVIVLLIVIMVFSIFLIGSADTTITANANSPNSIQVSPFTQMLGIGVYFGINIAVIAIFWKIFKDCAERQDILMDSDLPTNPEKLKSALQKSESSSAPSS